MKILTFDIEDWFHILDNPSTKTQKDWLKYDSRIHQNMELIFKLLSTTDTKATFFCLGWIAKKYPEVIKEINSRGYEIGTHSHMHQLVYQQKRKEFKNDLEYSVKTIEDIIGKKIRSYRAPGFSIRKDSLWAFEIIAQLGIEVDCSLFSSKRAHGGFTDHNIVKPCIIQYKGLRLKEFPISPVSIMGKNLIYSGGGYFRLLPYWLINSFTKKSIYTMTYFHPRDFDYGQPMIEDLSFLRKFKSYYGLKHTYNKLYKLLTRHKFSDIISFDKEIDWNTKRIIELK